MEYLNCINNKKQICNPFSLPARYGTICPEPSTPKGSRSVRAKRAVLCAVKKASLTVEAAMAVPLFFFAVICLISITDIYAKTTEKIMELRTAAETAAMIPGSKDDISLLVPVVFTPHFLPEGVMSRTVVCGAYVKAWDGRSDEEKAAGEAAHTEYVYVTDNMSVYHTSAECSHLDLSIHTVSGNISVFITNEEGRHYHACEKCASEGRGDVVYVTEHGECYHNSYNCSGLTRNVKMVDASTVEGLHVCSRCTDGS